MKYKAIIIDDEHSAIDMIEFLLKKNFSQIEIVAKASTIKDGIFQIEKKNPDIVFLDIELKEGSGFEIREATKDLGYNLIFTTAYTQYAIQAFKARAFDYIVKPIDENDFCLAVSRALDNKKSSAIKKIQFTTHEGTFYLESEEILYLKSDSNYTNVYLRNDKVLLLSKTLKEVEQKLPLEQFIRIHNSYIINAFYITNYQKGNVGSILLNNSIVIPVSKSKKNVLKQFLTSLKT